MLICVRVLIGLLTDLIDSSQGCVHTHGEFAIVAHPPSEMYMYVDIRMDLPICNLRTPRRPRGQVDRQV